MGWYMHRKMTAIFILAFCAAAGFADEAGVAKSPFTVFFPVGYDVIKLDRQIVHSPAAGAGFLMGSQDIPFTEVERRFFGLALYQPFIFREAPDSGLPKLYHDIGGLFDGRINRHQILCIFQASSNEPVAGGLNTFQIGAGWGYEVIRRQHVSLILGAVLGVSNFGDMLSVEATVPVLPLPLIRFGIDTRWFASSFDFITGPNFEFTVAPESKFRLTGDMRMDEFRSFDDLICEFALWYRFFGSEHRLGDVAGIGAGFKNDVKDFSLANTEMRAKDFGLLERSVFAVLDLSILKIEGGWVFDSRYLVDGEKSGNPGRGFFISVQGLIPVINR